MKGIMTDDDRRRLIDYLERLGEQKVRLYSGIDCARFFGDWQAAEVIDDWLAGKATERRESLRWMRLRRPVGLR